jgi:deoxyadenosine/deoxycytidine kinase
MYILEGNIGAGKSTLLSLLNKSVPAIKVITEPLHHWETQLQGQSLLANFYADPQRWSYTIETLAMTSRVQDHLHYQQDKHPYKLAERSLYSGYYCFARNGYSNGFMTPVEWYAYTSWFDYFVPRYCMPPLGFVYLQVDPEIAYNRILQRQRSSETQISLSYLQQIHAYHEDFLIHKKNVMPAMQEVPVLILDGNDDFEKNSLLFEQHQRNLLAFMQTANQVALRRRERLL